MKTFRSIPFVLVTGLFFSTACDPKPTAQTTSTVPDAPVTQSLFNGKDLSGWYTYQRRPEPGSDVPGMARDEEGNYTQPIGNNNDPLQVFTVVVEDDSPAIRISGEVFGILVTEQEYENYHLKLQFKWGQKKYAPRENDIRDSGILYHSIGKEGAWGDVWMKSLECQVQEGDCGDYISVDTVMVDIPALYNDQKRYNYQAGAEKMTFSHERSYCDHGADHENPTGEWNTMEIYTANGNSVHLVNGVVNMATFNSRYPGPDGTEIPLVRGKIQLQSEGAEIFYRNIELTPIQEIPAEWMP
ncbi:MAG: DUF1080 domain-containing protein [Cyclobacteriaceae bacterium]|nr:DUF1080 domain-containing protein [Cyclobacteriaceae bacterium]